MKPTDTTDANTAWAAQIASSTSQRARAAHPRTMGDARDQIKPIHPVSSHDVRSSRCMVVPGWIELIGDLWSPRFSVSRPAVCAWLGSCFTFDRNAYCLQLRSQPLLTRLLAAALVSPLDAAANRRPAV